MNLRQSRFHRLRALAAAQENEARILGCRVLTLVASLARVPSAAEERQHRDSFVRLLLFQLQSSDSGARLYFFSRTECMMVIAR